MISSNKNKINIIPITLFLFFQGSLSDDERSGHYSSSGYYESPVEDDDDGGLSKIHLLTLSVMFFF